jgi:hypothetical protein
LMSKCGLDSEGIAKAILARFSGLIPAKVVANTAIAGK